MFATTMGNDPEDSARVIHKALDAGINLIDTADAYGDSEDVVGQALKGRRDDVVLATKFGRPAGQDPNQHSDLRRAGLFRHLNDERRLDIVEQLVPLAEEAGLPMTHLAMAFTIAHPGVTSALLGARTMDHLDGLLAGLEVALTDDILDRIDELVPPGTDVGTLDQAYQPPALENPGLRRRPPATRAAA
jgi:aryl-alcohol dehydrogenase-like predicted oxidoreductase